MKTRAPLLVAVLVCLSTARAGRAETDLPQGGAADDAASPAAPASPAVEAGGLFEQSVAAGGTSPGVTPPFTLTGYLRGDVFVGKAPDQQAGETKASYGELSVQLRTARSPHGDGFAELRVRYGLQGNEQRTFLDVREAYANAYLGRLDLRIGQQIIVWGRADALNPTSNVTPVDFRIRSPLEDDIRIGNVGARAFLRYAPFRLEGVWMPVYRPTELPPVSLPRYVSFGAPVFPTPTLENGLYAGRLHLELPRFEMSVSYLRGFAPIPGVTLTGLTFDPETPSVLVSRTAYDHQVVGFDFSTALGEVMTIRGEAAYRRPFDYQRKPYAARPDLQYVLGADHSFGAVNVIAQYMGRYVFDWQKERGPAMDLDTEILKGDPNDLMDVATDAINAELAKSSQILFSQTARLQHLATLRLEWQLRHETLSLSALGLVNFTTREWVLMPRVGYRFSDTMVGYVGAQIFRGPDDTLFGLIDDELTAGYVELRTTF